MSDPRDPLAAFDDEHLRAAAADENVDPADLRSLVRRHQERVRELPGVENLVYEWRRTFPRSPLIERREDAYYLLLRTDVWAEYREALSLTDVAFAALQTAHAQQFAAAVGGESDGGGSGAADHEDRKPMVLTRT